MPPDPLPDLLDLWQTTLHWTPTAEQHTCFEAVFQAILQGNQQLNLTRITAPLDFWEKHLWDSISGMHPWLLAESDRPAWATLPPSTQVIDIGTGAGFPGIPAAISFPDWHVTLLDATQKKVRFLQDLVAATKLTNVRAVSYRAEAVGHQPAHREVYHLALIRAVGAATTCAELALPLLRIGGVAVLYRGQWPEADHQQLTSAVECLGGHLAAVQAWETPLTKGIRHCVYLQKVTETDDDYPRAVGIPAKHPL
jgi:16S rRNA (guanine527-N7)-methyltransferase